MKRCGHTRGGETIVRMMVFEICSYSYLRCKICGAWLPLGPSNDDSEAVQIEIRAAELAGVDRAQVPIDEFAGWFFGEEFRDVEYSSGFLAGYLARIIVEHSDG